MNKFVRTKSPTVCKFSKIFFQQLYTGWTVVVYLCCGFSLWRQKAPQQSAKFRTALFGQFRTSLRKDSVANYSSIWTLFTLYVKGLDVLCKLLNIPHFRRQVAPQEWKIFGGNFTKRKKSAAELCQILRMVTVEIVINHFV